MLVFDILLLHLDDETYKGYIKNYRENIIFSNFERIDRYVKSTGTSHFISFNPGTSQ